MQRGLFILVTLTLIALTGCTTTGSTTKADSRHSGKTSGKKIILISPDGTRREIPYQDNPPPGEFVAPPYVWQPDSSPTGPVTLHIVLDEQVIYAFRGGQMIGWSQISTGKEGHNTPPGRYKILQKNVDHKSNLYGSFVDASTGKYMGDASPGDRAPAGAVYQPAPMKYFQRLTNDGIGLHEGFLPGFAASHGCIRVHPHMAPRLFEITQLGTPVFISQSRNF